jgi:hypothetical protein
MAGYVSQRDVNMSHGSHGAFGSIGNQQIKETPQGRVLSSLLTFPLTLSYAISHVYRALYPWMSLPEIPIEERKKLFNVLVVGARSESSLPLTWWKEGLYNFDSIPHNTGESGVLCAEGDEIISVNYLLIPIALPLPISSAPLDYKSFA